jgi:very-short-patch-repair endonuclease
VSRHASSSHTAEDRRFARSMRRAPTEAEDRLWGALRGRRLNRIKFKRQAPVGTYIADFLCAEAMLIVEIDGT